MSRDGRGGVDNVIADVHTDNIKKELTKNMKGSTPEIATKKEEMGQEEVVRELVVIDVYDGGLKQRFLRKKSTGKEKDYHNFTDNLYEAERFENIFDAMTAVRDLTQMMVDEIRKEKGEKYDTLSLLKHLQQHYGTDLITREVSKN